MRPDRAPRKPRKDERVRVWWSDEKQWFSGTVTSSKQRLTRVRYDATDRWEQHACWHDLADECWERL